MAARGHFPPAFEGRSMQAPGMLRHGPLPIPAGHHPLEHHMPAVEFLDKKIADQAAEMDRINNENRRLAETHIVMRQHLGATHHEMQQIQADISRVHAESDVQVRGLMEKIAKMESGILAGEMLRKELQQAHLEAQSLLAERQELNAELQHGSEELQKASIDRKALPAMHDEVEALRQEHQNLRSAFEYEKGINMDQVERMQAMDKNLMSMTKEVEKLRADVLNVEKKAGAANPYGSTYGSPAPVYQQAGQGTGYPDSGYSQGSGYQHMGYGAGGYTNSGYGQVAPASHPGAYGRPQSQASSGVVQEGVHPYGSMSNAGYPDGYARAQAQATGGVAAGDGVNPYAGGVAAPYGSARAPPTAAPR